MKTAAQRAAKKPTREQLLKLLDTERSVLTAMAEGVAPFVKAYAEFREDWDSENENEWEPNPELDLTLDVQAKYWKHLQDVAALANHRLSLSQSEWTGAEKRIAI